MTDIEDDTNPAVVNHIREWIDSLQMKTDDPAYDYNKKPPSAVPRGKNVGACLTVEELGMLRRFCKETNRIQKDIIREAILEYLERNKG